MIYKDIPIQCGALGTLKADIETISHVITRIWLDLGSNVRFNILYMIEEEALKGIRDAIEEIESRKEGST